MESKVLVSICSITYNHEKYIRQCLDGFLMQKTDFPFEVIIHDDASTDKTADIIREYEAKYPNIIKPIYQKENQYSKGVEICNTYVYPKAQGKYIALCEGDDYWIDPLKLQKQVDFLEGHPDFGFVYSKVDCFLQNRGRVVDCFGKEFNSFGELLLGGNVIPTLSVVFKRELYNKYNEEILSQKHADWKMGDYPMWLYFAYNSRWGFLNEVTGVYRKLAESASHSKDVKKLLGFADSYHEIKLFYLYKYKLNDERNVNYLNELYLWNLCRIYSKTHDKDVVKYLKEKYHSVSLSFSLYYVILSLIIRFPILHYFLTGYNAVRYRD